MAFGILAVLNASDAHRVRSVGGLFLERGRPRDAEPTRPPTRSWPNTGSGVDLLPPFAPSHPWGRPHPGSVPLAGSDWSCDNQPMRQGGDASLALILLPSLGWVPAIRGRRMEPVGIGPRRGSPRTGDRWGRLTAVQPHHGRVHRRRWYRVRNRLGWQRPGRGHLPRRSVRHPERAHHALGFGIYTGTRTTWTGRGRVPPRTGHHVSATRNDRFDHRIRRQGVA